MAVAAVLGLALVAAVWWTYFADDDELAEAALSRADDNRRTTLIMNGYFYAHIPIMIGIVTAAAGVKVALGDLSGPLDAAPAFALAGGITSYLLGDVMFRRALRIGPSAVRAAAAALCLAAVPLGVRATGLAELVALLVVLGATLTAERLLPLRANEAGRLEA
jgi:low temperature requirement protein LtrA